MLFELWRWVKKVSDETIERHTTNLDRTVLENEASSQHDLLICASDMKVEGLAMVYDEIRDMAVMELHSR